MSWPATPAALAALPALTAPESISNGAINWGVRNSLRATVNANGVLQPRRWRRTQRSDSDMSGAGKFFTWPASTGQYEAGTPGRLVLHGSGSVGLCNTAHGYGTVLSDPTRGHRRGQIAPRHGRCHPSGQLLDQRSRRPRRRGDRRGREDARTRARAPAKRRSPGRSPTSAPTTPWAVVTTTATRPTARSSWPPVAPAASTCWAAPYKTVGTALNKLSVSIVHPEPTP